MSEDQERGGLPSASSLDRHHHCPGSFAACRGLADLPEESIATQGTNIHQAMETGEDEDLGLTEQQIKDRLTAMELRATDEWRLAVDNGDI